jgi:hypothetical protein
MEIQLACLFLNFSFNQDTWDEYWTKQTEANKIDETNTDCICWMKHGRAPWQ